MKIRILSFIICIISICTFNLRETKSKQNFDSYIFALQWPNGYCQINKCQSVLEKYEKNILTIHGLWPSLKIGDLLKPCTTGVEIVEENTEIYNNMRKYWPSFQKTNVDFWKHEYNRHGYCMVQEKNWEDYEDYFNFVINLYLKDYKYLMQKAFLNDNINKKKLFTLSYEEIQKRIQKVIPNANFKMNCKSDYLFEFYFYLEENFTPSKNSNFVNTCKNAKIIFS